MSHQVKPSVDLEGASERPITRQRSFLRPSRQDPVQEDESATPVTTIAPPSTSSSSSSPRDAPTLVLPVSVAPPQTEQPRAMPLSIRVDNVDVSRPHTRDDQPRKSLWKRNDLALQLPRTNDPALEPKSPSYHTPLTSVFASSPTKASSAPTSASLRSPKPRTLTKKTSATNLTGTLAESVSKLKKRPSALELPTRAPNSPSLQVTSPSMPKTPLTATLMLRKNSGLAAQAREKAKEKDSEEKEQRAKAKLMAKHSRMFSFVDRDMDSLAIKGSRKLDIRLPKLNRKFILAVIAVGCVWLLASTWRSAPKPVRRTGSPLRKTYTRRPTPTPKFIHPDVITRRGPAAKQRSWLGRLLFGPSVAPAALHASLHTYEDHLARRQARSAAAKASRPQFKAAPAVPFASHHPLPPPPVHDDAPERDTLILYRILGNELPPRHTVGQMLQNLRFLLENESDFSALAPIGPHPIHHANAYGSGSNAKKMQSLDGGLRVDKYFVLNRIADEGLFNAIIGLLHLYSVPNSRILVIPFEFTEYTRRDFVWDHGVARFAGWHLGTGSGTDAADDLPIDLVTKGPDDNGVDPEARRAHRDAEVSAKLKALDFTLHEKNLYAMNNNGGRNFALHHGRSLAHARWVLPLDGNAFLTPAAMDSIIRTLSVSGEGEHASRYIVMPMHRLLDNQEVLANNSIALVPKHDHNAHDDALAAAEAYHRTAGAPEATDEPQIGFRYDSTETFEEAMRYGRRSKLELLWRLGALPYSTGLDKRTYMWESNERMHVSRMTWGSIPGVAGKKESDRLHKAQEASEGEFWTSDAPPSRGPLAFVRAGWVYRLFSGDVEQEQPTAEAAALRSLNRMRGIIDYIEDLDEQVARGLDGCAGERSCGFSKDHLFNFDLNDLERLHQKYLLRDRETREDVEAFEDDLSTAYRRLTYADRSSDATEVATNATMLAIAGFITGNATYSTLAGKAIEERFGASMYLTHDEHAEDKSLRAEIGNGYIFPRFKDDLEDDDIVWHSARIVESDLPPLPFDALEFDPSLLYDAVRILRSPKSPANAISKQVAHLEETAIIHLSTLLHSKAGIERSADPPSFEAGAFFDLQIASLAAYLDDVRLLNRVLSRSGIRQRTVRSEPVSASPSKMLHVRRLQQGAINAQVRPFSMAWTRDDSRATNGWLMNDTPLRFLDL